MADKKEDKHVRKLSFSACTRTIPALLRRWLPRWNTRRWRCRVSATGSDEAAVRWRRRRRRSNRTCGWRSDSGACRRDPVPCSCSWWPERPTSTPGWHRRGRLRHKQDLWESQRVIIVLLRFYQLLLNAIEKQQTIFSIINVMECIFLNISISDVTV